MPRAKSMDLRWVPPGEKVTVQGMEISEGMLYVGSHMPAGASGWRLGIPAACLVDPSLPIGTPYIVPEDSQARVVQDIGWSPTYAALSPGARRRYLEWVAGGRSAPGIPHGYVMLFVYGLERRLLVDGPPPVERALIEAELSRLLMSYGDDQPVAYRIESLLRHARWQEFVSRPGWDLEWRPDPAGECHEMSGPLRIATGRRVAAGQPLGFDLAMATLLCMTHGMGGMKPRIGAVRTKAAFLTMMRKRFDEKWPSGIRLRDRGGSKLSISYQAACPHLEVPPLTTAERVPDPFALTWNRMTVLCDAVMDELAPYARLVKDDWSGAGSAEAAAAMPQSLYDIRFGPLETVDAWLSSLAEKTNRVVAKELWELCDRTGAPQTVRGTKAVGALLAGLGYGMEPDPSTGWSPVPPDGSVQVYRTGTVDAGEVRSQPGPDFVCARLACLGIAAAAAAQGLESALSYVLEKTHMAPCEVLRLEALCAGIAGFPVGKAMLTRAAAAVEPSDREVAAALCLDTLQHTGPLQTQGIGVIETVFALLGQPREALYSTIHRKAAAGVYAPMCSHDVPESSGTLDLARLARIREETSSVSGMLSEVYSESPEKEVAEDGLRECAEPAVQRTETQAESRFAGLDAVHAALVEALCRRPEWSKASYQSLVHSFGLWPDGALDTINEWAFERYDEPLVEDGEPMTVDTSLLDREPV